MTFINDLKEITTLDDPVIVKERRKVIKDIDVSNITVKLGRKVILEGVSLTVERGQFFAVVGLSGAGKSKLTQCLSGQIKPKKGSGKVLGFDVRKKQKKILKSIDKGYVPQDDLANLYLEFSAIYNIQLYGSNYRPELNTKKGLEEIHKILDILEIPQEIRDTPVKFLSGGEKKRISIAMVLAHGPKLVFLDEVTTGLDESLKLKIFNYLKKINKEYKITMFLISHNLDICSLVDELLILRHGKPIPIEKNDKIVTQYSPMALIRTLPSNGLTIKIKFSYVRDIEERIDRFTSSPFLKSILWQSLYVGRNLYKFFCRDMPSALAGLLRKIYDVGLDPISIVLDDATLLDFFLLQEKKEKIK
ncbi:MAG: ATP-binding cassette domain-containing protein [Candidatus Thorarchaeota archaeon]